MNITLLIARRLSAFLSARLLGCIFLLALVAAGGRAQSATDGSTPLGLAPGSPAGSYALSDFESVNLYNGTLSFNLPLLKVAGRGGAGHDVTIRMEQKWLVTKFREQPGQPYVYMAEPNWWNEDGGGMIRAYSAGGMHVRQGHSEQFTLGCNGVYVYTKTLTRLTFTAPDGTEYDLRDQLTNGQPVQQAPCGSAFNRGKVFVTSDGPAATYVSDTDITDIYDDDVQDLDLFGYLLLRDGTRFRIDAGKITWMRDRNGNKVTFTYDTYERVASITDSLNRQITITYATLTVPYDLINFKGFGGTARTLKVGQTKLGNVLRSDFTLQTTLQLFPNMSASTPSHNPTVFSYVELPDGRRYDFQYNSYGELARVVLPTGGAVEYDYAAGLTDAESSGMFLIGADKYIYRRVVERRMYPDGAAGAAYASKTTYSRPETTTGVNAGYVISETLSQAGALLARSKHYFYGSARASFGQKPTDYAGWKDGREYKTETFDTNGTTLLRVVAHTFAQRASVSWWTGTDDTEPPSDPRTTQTVTTLSDTNQVTKQTFLYDQYNNQTDVYEYNFGAGAAGSLVRRTHTDYVTANVVNGVTYNYDSDTAIHLRSLPKQVSIYNTAGVEQARTTYEYDNYTATANHAALTARSGISGLDSTFTTSKRTRGNATATTRYLLTAGAVTDSISTFQQYDVGGNVTKAIDALGNVTTFGFSDCFGAPDAEATINAGAVELATQQSYAFPTLVTNDLGHAVYTQRDYSTGLVVDVEDANGVTTSAYYEDALERPTKIMRASNDAALHNQIVFTYNDTTRVITAASDHDTFADTTPLKSQTYYDGLGRTVETRVYETATNYTANKTTYDALGRVSQLSNPFRNGQTPVWTTTAYDALGRVTTVTPPDNAVVTTAYSGNTTTVTDQTGRDWQSTTDALGRVTQVIEDPGTGGLGYSTAYLYDVMDNLRRVAQDTQRRYFMYDSLSRLILVKNPEQTANASLALTDPVSNNSQWSVGYTYDDNGNVATRTDARNITSTYTYDGLNRNTLVTHSNGTRVERTYDTATNGKGRLAASYYYIDTGVNAGAHSRTTIGGYDAMGRPLSQSQYFYANGSWGTPFVTQRTYNLTGAVKSQTYPSGRVVNYTYDLAGRASGFTGNLGDGVTRSYATSITYDVWGGLTRERFGTSTPLFHKERRNIRGQLYDMRLSTVNDADNWNRGAVVNFYSLSNYGFGLSGTDNNGNLYVQQHFVPADDAITTSSFMQQNYDYDQLNRLRWVGEYPQGDPALHSGAQEFDYDLFGNRTIDPVTWGTGINEKQFTVVTAKNQLGVPAGQTGAMQYDAMGNLYNDTYSGDGARTFDAENRMVTATNTADQQSIYTYDADGRRVRRNSYNQETWQVYGMEGELLAEYAAGSAVTSPQKEYGYRNDQLLVTATSGADVRWLVTDHLGTPRIIADKTGSLAGIRRHDYLPFGEELFAGTGNRTTQQGYQSNDGVRQQFTRTERDVETGLDYFGARYLSSIQGRFLSVDPMMASGLAVDPQTWNRYAYVANNPLRFVDEGGLLRRDRNGNLKFEPVGLPRVETHGSGERSNVQWGYLTTDNGTRILAWKNIGNNHLMDTDCHGLSFADGEYWVNNDQVDALLDGDNYEETNEPQVGDIVIYREGNNPVHSTTVVGVDADGNVTEVAGLGGVQPESGVTSPRGGWRNPNATRKYYHKRSDSRTAQQRQQNLNRVRAHNKWSSRLQKSFFKEQYKKMIDRMGPPPKMPKPKKKKKESDQNP